MHAVAGADLLDQLGQRDQRVGQTGRPAGALELGERRVEPPGQGLDLLQRLPALRDHHVQVERIVRLDHVALSQRRADAVRAALIARGVDPQRLRAKGYGSYCPEEPNETEAGRQRNRRVDFKIAKNTQGPPGVELGCPAAKAAGIVADPVP